MTTDTAPAFPVCQCCPRRLLGPEVQHGRLVPALRAAHRRRARRGRRPLGTPPRTPHPRHGRGDDAGERTAGPTGSKPPTNLAVLSSSAAA
ncbi:hypothetical protein ACFQ3Z_15780 [Streptomyces nogalater]